MAKLPEFMGSNGLTWFLGNVEDVDDPLLIGRVRVRYHAYHSEDKEELPTDTLPWAIVIKPNVAGSFSSPNGLTVNTTVLGIFADGPIGQYPIILGVISGINTREGSAISATNEDILNNNAGGTPLINGVDIEGETNPSEPITTQFIGSINETQYKELKNAIGKRESGNNYQAVNSIGFIGKYQFGNAALYDLGYTVSKSSNNRLLTEKSNWKGKNGINDLESFLRNQGNVQELVMDEYVKMNYKRLLSNGTVTPITPPRELAGYLTVAHLLGSGGALKFKNGNDGRDGYGTTGKSYYQLGYKSISDSITKLT